MAEFDNGENLGSVRAKINEAIRKTEGDDPLTASPGSALAPGLTFNGDQNTGFYRPEEDVVAISAGGIERFRVTSSGAWGLSGPTFGTPGQVLVSAGPGAAVAWGSINFAPYMQKSANLADLANVDEAQTNLGASALGKALFTTPSASAARSSLGSTATGDAVFTSADVAAVRALLELGDLALADAADFVELQATWNAGVSTEQATISPAQLAATRVARDLGWGQTPQNLTGSRALATAYQNTTGRPIFVSVATGNGGNNYTLTLELSVNALTWVPMAAFLAVDRGGASASSIVPDQYFYRAVLSATSAPITLWSEIR